MCGKKNEPVDIFCVSACIYTHRWKLNPLWRINIHNVVFKTHHGAQIVVGSWFAKLRMCGKKNAPVKIFCISACIYTQRCK